ncbi:MAG: FxsA family protein [Mariprofundales bacterium]|nr:FxsA family protein [Mariprofundales bacterium]
MLRIIFFLFLIVPLIELYVLIRVGAGIGGLATIALCLLTAAIGGLLVRFQGMQILFNAQRQIAQGALPAEQGMHGIMIAAAGVLLFLPGFVTDSLGFLLLIPPIRQLVIRRLLGHQLAGRNRRSPESGVIDAEIIEIDPHHLP